MTTGGSANPSDPTPPFPAICPSCGDDEVAEDLPLCLDCLEAGEDPDEWAAWEGSDPDERRTPPTEVRRDLDLGPTHRPTRDRRRLDHDAALDPDPERRPREGHPHPHDD